MVTVADPGASPPRQSSWAPLRHRVFFALFVAQLASNLGTLMQVVGSTWLMGDLGGSAALVALVQTATFLPVFIVGIPAGAFADIFDRRKLLITTQCWMMLCAFALAALSFADRVTPGSLLALTFALGLGAALNTPAWFAIQPDLVPKEEFGQAVALGAMTYNVGRAVGPALGGLIVAAAGPAWVFLLNGLSFVGIVAVLSGWRPATTESRFPTETLSGATRAGLRYAMHAPMVRAVLMRVVLLVLPGVAIQALLPIVARGPLGLGSGGYGALLGCFGAGAAIAAILRPHVQRRLGGDAQIRVSSVLLGGAILVQGYADQAWVVGVALFIGGAAWSIATIAANVAAQGALPAWVRARGIALYTLALTGSFSIGSALFGLVADHNLQRAHLLAAAMLGVGALGAWRWKIDWAPTLDLTPLPAEEPIVAFIPEPADGPVLVTVEYQVSSDRAVAFGNAMRLVEQQRRRTGAYQWGLFRDLAVPERFLETFVVGSWAEHLRQHHRTTASGHAVLRSVDEFSQPERVVSHLISSYSAGALAHVDAHPEYRELAEDD